MAKFLTDLEVECINDNKWRLLQDLVYESDITDTITVRSGFETDFASVPRIPIIFMLFGNEAHKPAVVHDWCYRRAIVKREIADKVFLEAMNVVGIGWKRYPIFWGVRLFGGPCYA